MATDRWKHAAVYIPSIPIQRVVAEKGFSAAALASDVTDQVALTTVRCARIALAEPLASVLAAGTVCELHGTMPPVSREMGRGLHGCINRALRASVIRDRISVTTVSGSGRYSLASYPWFTDESQLIGVSDSEALSNVDGSPLFQGGEIRFDAEVPYLLINTNPSSSTFYIDVWRPRGSWVRVSGTWGASTVGLVNETDAVSIDPDWLTFLSYVYACQSLAHAWRGDQMGGYWQSQYDTLWPTAETRLARERTLDYPLPHMGHTDSIRRLDDPGQTWGWP